MKKSEIIQLALIIFGILIITWTLENLSIQTGITLGNPYNNGEVNLWLFYFAGIFIILALIGFLIIRKSGYLSKKIITDEDDGTEKTLLARSDVITLAIIIMSLYFIISGFPSFISSFLTLAFSFFDDFKMFKEMLPDQSVRIIWYFLLILIFMKANYISNWIEMNLMTLNKN